jgi:hypothetical protein
MMLAVAAPDVWSRSDKLTLWALGIAVVGVLIALKTLRRGNLNASVALASSLMGDIQISLNDYIKSIPDSASILSNEQETEMTEKLELLMNRLEMASAICIERSLFGISMTLVENYVRDVLNLIVKNAYVSAKAGKLLQEDETFKYIRWFLRIAPVGSIIVPDGWYVRYKPGWFEWVRVKIGWAA